MSGTLDSIGLAVRQCDDGWIVMVVILLEELETVLLEPADLRAMERETVAAVNEVRRRRGLEELVSAPDGRWVDDRVQTAVESWMRSRRHREAMLTPDYTHTAIGVAVDDDGELYFTQLFLLR